MADRVTATCHSHDPTHTRRPPLIITTRGGLVWSGPNRHHTQSQGLSGAKGSKRRTENPSGGEGEYLAEATKYYKLGVEREAELSRFWGVEEVREPPLLPLQSRRPGMAKVIFPSYMFFCKSLHPGNWIH